MHLITAACENRLDRFSLKQNRQLQAVKEIHSRCCFERISTTKSYNKKVLYSFLHSKLSYRSREVFAIVLFDIHNNFICYQELFYGSNKQSNIYPREIIKCALNHNASGIICAHNHPSGNINISEADKLLTKYLVKILRTVDIALLDHIIIANQNVSIRHTHSGLFV